MIMDKEYWDNMGERNLILEGRIPKDNNEIIVMRSLIKENPSYEVGSKISVNLGYREKDGEEVDVFDFLHSDERFISKNVEEYTIVGIISAVVFKGLTSLYMIEGIFQLKGETVYV